MTAEEPVTEDIEAIVEEEQDPKFTQINLLLLVLVAALGEQVGVAIGGDIILDILPSMPQASMEIFVCLFAMFMIAWYSREYFRRK